jgi:hypothetical protein
MGRISFPSRVSDRVTPSKQAMCSEASCDRMVTRFSGPTVFLVALMSRATAPWYSTRSYRPVGIVAGTRTSRISMVPNRHPAGIADRCSPPRAFLLAGAKSVLASLWTADGIFTTALMKRFCQHLVSGQGKGTALRQAKLDLLGSGSPSLDAEPPSARTRLVESLGGCPTRLLSLRWVLRRPARIRGPFQDPVPGRFDRASCLAARPYRCSWTPGSVDPAGR